MFKPEYDLIPLDGDNPVAPLSRTIIRADHDQPTKILQSCNGLILSTNGGFREGKLKYYICNPTTKQFTTILNPDDRPLVMIGGIGIDSVYAMNLAFDSRKSPHFKVLAVFISKRLRDHYEMEIYSSETGKWKSINDPFFAEVNFKIGVYWNNAMNWFSVHGEGLYFDLDDERFGTMPMPPIPEGYEERRVRYFGESHDHLHLIEIYGSHTNRFNVYEMDKEYSGWFVRYRVDIGPVVDALPEVICGWLSPSDLHYQKFLVMSLVRGRNRDDESFLVFSIPGKAIRYNLGDKSFKMIWEFDSAEDMFGWYECFQYIESIAAI